jgi:hypothetical protein
MTVSVCARVYRDPQNFRGGFPERHASDAQALLGFFAGGVQVKFDSVDDRDLGRKPAFNQVLFDEAYRRAPPVSIE